MRLATSVRVNILDSCNWDIETMIEKIIEQGEQIEKLEGQLDTLQEQYNALSFKEEN